MTRLMNTYGLVLFLALGLAITPSTARAEADLGRIDLGSYVTGPKISKDDLKGRFVIVEYWGVNCGPCVASIPHMSKLAEAYGHQRLVVVAIHRQGGSDDKVKEVWESRAKSNYVAVSNNGNLPGFGNGSIPIAILFAPSGKEIWQGHPTSVDKTLKQAMRSFRWPKPTKEEAPAADPIVTGIEAQYFKRQIDDINEQRRSIDNPLAQIRRFAERAPKEEQQAEANAILAAVTQWAQTRQSAINQAMSDDPATAYAQVDQAIELIGRDELAASFVEAKQKMEADDALMDRVRSTRMLREVLAQAKSIGLTEDPAAANDKKNSRDVRAITRDLDRIIKTWPETNAATQAKELQSKWGLEG